MSEINVPQGSPVDRTFVPPASQVESESPQTASPSTSSTSTKDSLETFSTDALNLSTQQASTIPPLETPDDHSLLSYFKKINAASRALRDQLIASDRVDQESRRISSRSAAASAIALSQLFETRKQAIENLDAEAKQAGDDIQKKLDEMRKETQQQQDRVDKIKKGDAEEEKRYERLNHAYDDYIQGLKSLGAEDQGNGNYSIPEGAEDKYNALTQKYQQEVKDFNAYWKERETQIKEYNSATIAYNQSVATNNAYIDDLTNKYELSSPLPKQTGAELRDLSGYQDEMDAPSTISSTPAVVSTYPPPSYARTIGSSGPPSPPKLDAYSPPNAANLHDDIYKSLYKTEITPLDREIDAKYLSWSALYMQSLFTPKQDLVPEPLLNTKSLALRILPDAFIIPRDANIIGSRLDQTEIGMGASGLESSSLEAILGRALLKQALENSNLKLLKNEDPKSREQKIDLLADQLLLLSMELLKSQGLRALFPSLSIISQSLNALPKDSPVFAILFAVSLVNRTQEDAKQGTTTDALQVFLDGNPDLANLTEEDKAQLTAILNLGQLLVAAKLLEESLGLQGLLAQILPNLSPALDFTSLVSKADQESKQEITELNSQIKQRFIDQGYPEDKAQFLADVGSQLAKQGLLTPNATSVNSSHTFNEPLLIDSVKAALVLADYSLTQADSIAREAVSNSLIEGPYHSTKQFRTALESHLEDLGVHEKSTEIANQAVLIPPKEKSLDLLATSTTSSTGKVEASPPSTAAVEKSPPSTATVEKSTPSTGPEKTMPLESHLEDLGVAETSNLSASVATSSLSQTTPVQPPRLSLTQLMTILEKRSLQLLVPQLGAQVAKQVTEEIARTLFGTPNPDSRDVADVKSPYSLVNVIKDQLYHLHVEQNKEWANQVSEAFKETIKTMEDFYAFSLKLMDPAYLFVYSSNVGIIYGDQGNKRPILI
jgi:hypothetical protein